MPSLTHLGQQEGRTPRVAESSSRKDPGIGHCVEDEHLGELPSKETPHASVGSKIPGCLLQQHLADDTLDLGAQGRGFSLHSIMDCPRGQGETAELKKSLTQLYSKVAINKRRETYCHK